MALLVYYLAIMVWAHFGNGLNLFRNSNSRNPEEVRINLVSTGNAYHRVKRSEAGLPGSISFQFQYGGNDVSLNLEKNYNVGSDTPVFLHRGGEAVRMGSSSSSQKIDDVAFYQDVTKGASIMLRRQEEMNNNYELMGTYYFADNQYSIEPVKHGKVKGAELTSLLNHTISILNEHLNLKDDIINFGNYEMSLENSIRYKRQAVESPLYTVELLMVVDNAIYKTWYNGIEEIDDAKKRTKTIETIKQYYAFVLNGIDVRYASIQEADLQIDVTFAGILIFDDSHDSYLSQNKSQPGDLVESSEALETFRNWVLSNMTSLPPSDHVMLFTGFNLTYGGSTSNAGLAYLQSICNHEYFFSIVEEYFEFRVISIAAHELGHSLGARHDMDENTCLSFQLYIMTSRFRFPSKSKAANPYRFSKCSIRYFKEFIFSLKSSGWTCLKTRTAVKDYREIAGYLVQQPGEVFSPDVQCQNSNGDSSYVCRARHNGDYSSICSQGMYCQDSELGKCSKILPADGTPCGNQRWCLNGVCVDEMTITRHGDDCPFYDTPFPVRYNDTCHDIVMASPWECYDTSIQLDCCDSCFYKFTNVSGCEYGDRVDDCIKELCNDYNETKRSSECCETCSNVPFPTRPIRTSTTTATTTTSPTVATSILDNPTTTPSPDIKTISGSLAVPNVVTPPDLDDDTTLYSSVTQYNGDVTFGTYTVLPDLDDDTTPFSSVTTPFNRDVTFGTRVALPDLGDDTTPVSSVTTQYNDDVIFGTHTTPGLDDDTTPVSSVTTQYNGDVKFETHTQPPDLDDDTTPFSSVTTQYNGHVTFGTHTSPRDLDDDTTLVSSVTTQYNGDVIFGTRTQPPNLDDDTTPFSSVTTQYNGHVTFGKQTPVVSSIPVTRTSPDAQDADTTHNTISKFNIITHKDVDAPDVHPDASTSTTNIPPLHTDAPQAEIPTQIKPPILDSPTRNLNTDDAALTSSPRNSISSDPPGRAHTGVGTRMYQTPQPDHDDFDRPSTTDKSYEINFVGNKPRNFETSNPPGHFHNSVGTRTYQTPTQGQEDFDKPSITDKSYEINYVGSKPDFVTLRNKNLRHTTNLDMTSVSHTQPTTRSKTGTWWSPNFNKHFPNRRGSSSQSSRNQGSSKDDHDSAENGNSSEEDLSESGLTSWRQNFLRELKTKVDEYDKRMVMWNSQEAPQSYYLNLLLASLSKTLDEPEDKQDDFKDLYEYDVDQPAGVPQTKHHQSRNSTHNQHATSDTRARATKTHQIASTQNVTSTVAPKLSKEPMGDNSQNEHLEASENNTVRDTPGFSKPTESTSKKQFSPSNPDWVWIYSKARERYQRKEKEERERQKRRRNKKKHGMNGKYDPQCIGDFLLSVYYGC